MICSQSQAQVPTLNLQSSSTLGTGKISTHRERLEKLEIKEARRVLGGRSGKRRRNNDSHDAHGPSSSDNEGENTDCSVIAIDDNGADEAEPIAVDSNSINRSVSSTSATIGSALQRNADGTVVVPKIVARNAKGKNVSIISFRD
jgi:ATP-dependent RNA helicase DHX37/DHR1